MMTKNIGWDAQPVAAEVIFMYDINAKDQIPANESDNACICNKGGPLRIFTEWCHLTTRVLQFKKLSKNALYYFVKNNTTSPG